jgi:hypothetical protein
VRSTGSINFVANFSEKREEKKKAYTCINFCSKMLISVLSLFTPNKSIPSAASQTSFMCV